MDTPRGTNGDIATLISTAAVMPTDEALRLLTYCEIGKSPAVPLWALMARREEVVDRLLAEISRSPAEIERIAVEAPDGRHLYCLNQMAAYLLAHWEEPRAFKPLVAHLAADSHLAAEHLGDTVTEDLHAILARIYDGSDLGPLKAIVEDDAAEVTIRNACLKSLHAMVRLGKIPREEMVAYYRHVAEALLRPANELLSDFLVSTLAETREPSLRSAIDRWLDDKKAGPSFVDRDEIDEIYASSDEQLSRDIDRHEELDALAAYLSGWAWFTSSDPAELDDDWDDRDDASIEDTLDWEARQPVVREHPKIGRNEPCPCGSGKKYKKCCLAKAAG